MWGSAGGDNDGAPLGDGAAGVHLAGGGINKLDFASFSGTAKSVGTMQGKLVDDLCLSDLIGSL